MQLQPELAGPSPQGSKVPAGMACVGHVLTARAASAVMQVHLGGLARMTDDCREQLSAWVEVLVGQEALVEQIVVSSNPSVGSLPTPPDPNADMSDRRAWFDVEAIRTNEGVRSLASVYLVRLLGLALACGSAPLRSSVLCVVARWS